MEKEKPIILKIRDFRLSLESLINESGLPAFLLTNIVGEFYRELITLEKTELETAVEYFESLKELPKLKGD